MKVIGVDCAKLMISFQYAILFFLFNTCSTYYFQLGKLQQQLFMTGSLKKDGGF